MHQLRNQQYLGTLYIELQTLLGINRWRKNIQSEIDLFTSITCYCKSTFSSGDNALAFSSGTYSLYPSASYAVIATVQRAWTCCTDGYVIGNLEND